MLVLTRRIGEAFLVGDAEVTILEMRGGAIRVGIAAPRSVTILRKELRAVGNSEAATEDIGSAPGAYREAERA
jgi:carbon storage regulator